MKSQLIVLALVAPLIGIVPVMAVASDDEFPSVEADSVQETFDQIKSSLVQQGFEILLTIDHGANAASVGLDLRPTLLIIYNDPRFELTLLRKSSTIGIDLPAKILVWQDRTGAIRRTFNPPGYLIDRHRVKGGLKGGLKALQKSANPQAFGRPDTGLITVDSAQPFENTVADLLAAIQAAPPPGPPTGFNIQLVLDYSDFQRTIRGRRPPVLILFGNPRVGTPLMQKEQSIGVDLPQKFLVWEDDRHDVHITYNDPLFLGKRHAIVDEAARLNGIAAVLDCLAKAAAGLIIPPRCSP